MARLLKERTAESHAEVESSLGLRTPGLTAARLGAVVQRLHGFWAGNEPSIDAWSQLHPIAAASIGWPRRRRTGLFAADLAGLGFSRAGIAAAPRSPAIFPSLGTAQVLGWLYVVEGSTLGGAIIDRQLRAAGSPVAHRLSCFTPYDEGPGAMWRALLAVIEQWAMADDVRSTDVIAASERTFESLARFLDPIAVAGVL